MSDPAPSIIGKVIGGYEIRELVGEGGMGAVYRARQLSLEREVAFKVLARRLAGNEEFVARFRREARSIAKVNHPNILQVHDVADAEGMHFIVMEFIRGTNLSAKLKDTGFVDWRECAEYMRQAALGLGGAAKAGIIHRDVKPDNIMITAEGVVKVSDFGLAKETTSTELTQTGDLMGTPAYMSPEQCDGGRLDTRTDIYSLGATFYRAVTGVLPFNAPTPVAMMYKQKHEPLIPPKQYMPNLPEAINQVIMRMMAKRPEERYQNMEDVAAAIAAALQGREEQPLDSTLKLPGTAPLPPAPPSPASFVPGENVGAPAGLGPLGGVDAAETAETLVARGDHLAGLGRIVAACECWKRALEQRPGDAGIKERLERSKKESSAQCLRIGSNLLEQGKLSAQRARLERILKVDPRNVDAREKMAALDFMEQQKRAAILQVRKYLSANEQEKALQLWESLHPSMRDRALLATMENLKHRVIPCRRLMAEAGELDGRGKFQEAFAKWDEALKLDPTNDRVKLGRQETHRRYERMESALRRGYEHNVKRQFQAAMDAFNEVLAICPGHEQAQRYITEALSELAAAAEDRHQFEAAIDFWQQVLARKPGDKSVMARLEQATRKRNALDAALADGKQALQQGRYGRSTSMFRKALAIQPDNKTAVYGIEEARRRRLRRRLLPAAMFLLLLVGGGGGILYLQCSQQVEQGDAALRNARRAGGNSEKLYDQAVARWRNAMLIPVFGTLRRRELGARIALAGAYRRIARKDRAYAQRDRKAFDRHCAGLERFLRGGGRGLGSEQVWRERFRLTWQGAHLLALEGKYSEAKARYAAALKLAASIAGVHLDDRQDGIRRAVDDYLLARSLLAGKGTDRDEREKQARALLVEAKRLWPGMAAADKLLQGLDSRQKRVRSILDRARSLITAAVVARRAGRHQEADSDLELAGKAAREVLALRPRLWAARKLAMEARWRAQAGKDMVFFVFPFSDDLPMERRFRAFALDRCEWPNRAGSPPATPTFKEALSLARAAGKDLPTMDEWRFAAQGEERRAYAYGNAYSEARGNTGRRLSQPWPCGSNPKAASPDGLLDLTGNVAEWVRVKGRDEDARRQYAMGGGFNSGVRECRNDACQLRDARIRHRDVGLRAARRWQIERER